MKENLKKLIGNMLFLNESQKKSLLAKLDSFTDAQMQEMEEKFLALHEKENELIKKFVNENAEFVEKIEVVAMTAEAEAEHSGTAEKAMRKFSKFK